MSRQEAAMADELDRAIVHCLQLNGRAPFRQIADLLGVSEQTVARRYRRMRGHGVLRVVTLANPEAYGQNSWMVRIQARPDSVRALARALAERDDVAWVTIGAGGTDIAAAVQSRSAADRDHLLLERLPRHTQVLGFSVHSVMHRFTRADGVDWTVQSPRVDADAERALIAGRTASNIGLSVRPESDDDALLTSLATDGRTTAADLANHTGWSQARVTRRLATLLGSGAIFLDVDIAQEVFGFPTTVDIWLTVEPAHLDTVGQALADLPEIAFCAAITGSANLMAVGLFAAGNGLYQFLTDRIGPLPGVRQAEISPVLQQVKQAGSLVERERLTSTPVRR